MVALNILCLYQAKSGRGESLAHSMAAGISAAGDRPVIASYWNGTIQADAVVAYGWGPWHQCFDAYRAAGRPYVFIDGGYWGRQKNLDLLHGFHKVIVNARHPVVKSGLPSDRIARFGIVPKPWRTRGSHILLAGMSAKNANDLGIMPEQWERDAIRLLRGVTHRPIIYRPKPTWKHPKQLPGAGFSPATQPLSAILRNCWAVVTHHSNVGVDALVEGIPIFTQDGAAKPFSMASMLDVENARQPDGREDFLAGLAYCQWSKAEMMSGECWQYIRQEAFNG